MKKWVVYIITTEYKGKVLLYTGMSNDVMKRLTTHNKNAGAKYTKGKGPWKLAYVEFVHTRSDALKREHQIKKLRRVDKLKLMAMLQLCDITVPQASKREG